MSGKQAILKGENMSTRYDEHCPTCGRFVPYDDGYFDLPPGGHYAHDYIVGYCNEGCANRKPIPCTYEESN